MKRIEYLINEIRRSTDNTDTNGVKDGEIIDYFNDGIRYIQSIVFQHMPKPVYFIAKQEYTPVGNGEYDLPDDMFNENSISTVEGKFGQSTINDGYRYLKRVFLEEAPDFFGYYTYNKKLKITSQEINTTLESIRLWYFRRARRFDKRWGQITTVNATTSLVLNASTYDSGLENENDIISVVDANGEIIRSNILISSFSSNTLNTSDALTGVQVGQYVVSGADSTTICGLPDSCETYLKDYVRQRMYTRNNYEDAGKQVFFTNKQELDIVSLFSQPSKELDVPPITDTDYLDI